MSISEYPYEIHRTISHGCQFRNIHTKSTDRYPVDVNFGISIRNPQNDILWMSISEYPYEIHGPISRGCPLWISIRNPQNDIPWTGAAVLSSGGKPVNYHSYCINRVLSSFHDH